MDLVVRNIDPVTVKRIEEAARKKQISREEYLRRMIGRTSVTDDVAVLEKRYSDLLEKTVACIRAQNEEIREIQHAVWQLLDQSENRGLDA